MWFGFGSVIGAGIFVITGLETQRHAGPAIVLSYVASGLSAMLSVFCYTEFSIEIPVAGGAFAYFTALLNRPSNSLRIHTNLAAGFNLLDPIAVAVLAIAGSCWCPKGMTTVLLVGTLGQARYITHIARAHMIPPWFALVHPKTGTPINATVLIAISSSCIAFFSSLEVLTGLLSVSTLFIFMMMAVALLVRRYYVKDITPKHHLLKLVIFLLIIIASSMGTAAYWGLNPNGWVGYAVTVPLWFFGTLAMAVFLPQQRSPKLWGVPLVPWLPSLSIATNIFLMGSLGPEAFERFGICTVVMLIYYVFFGLHATYDEAHKQEMPEESRTALSQTGHRFKSRLLSRSNDNDEIGELRKQSENDMKRCLTWWDLIWFGFGSVLGAGIFVLTGQETRTHAGPAIVLSFVVSGLSAMLSVFCYTEFSVEIPAAGGAFAYLRIELGDFVAFITAGNILLESIVVSAVAARAWTSYFTSLLNRPSDSLRIHTNLAAGFNLLDPIAVAVLAIAATIAMISTRKTSSLNWIASAVNIVIVLFVIIASFLNAKPSNLKPFFPFGAKGVFQAAAIVYFAYVGFDNIATMAEETKNPSRDIPLGLLGSMTIITVGYCLMALFLPMMQKYTDIDPNAAYPVAFQSVGMTWAKYLVALAALKGMTTVLLVGTLGQARYITHIARTHMIPPWFALVHPKTGTPINATVLIAISSGCIAFFTSLDILASLLSVSTLFIFMMMAVALLVRRYYVREITPQQHLLKLVIFLLIIIASSVGTSAYWGLNPNGRVGYVVTVPLWFFGTLAMAVFLPQQRSPKVWAVPLVPWLPSLSIATNIFLMGSLGPKAFERFGICTVIMLIYYVFFGLHATYDMAHKQDMQNPFLPTDISIFSNKLVAPGRPAPTFAHLQI